MRNNLLIVRAGDASQHPTWLGTPEAQRNFDLLVSYFGDTPGRFREGADHYHVMKGPRWPAHVAICAEMGEALARYERIGFACDDLEAPLVMWNDLFQTSTWYELDLAQPAVEGHVIRGITKPVEGLLLRYTNYVEIMCPVFSRRAFDRLRGTFGESVSGWGLSHLWSRMLPYPEYRQAVIDAVRVRHKSPVRQGTLRPTLDALGIDPLVEMADVLRRHGVSEFQMGEYARLRLSYQNE